MWQISSVVNHSTDPVIVADSSTSYAGTAHTVIAVGSVGSILMTDAGFQGGELWARRSSAAATTGCGSTADPERPR